MESKSLLLSIKSKVNIRLLFSYLNEERKYKLIVHSKKFQNILNLSLENYKEKFFFELTKSINFLNCLNTKIELDNCSNNSYKNIIKKNWDNELKQCKIHKNNINDKMNELTRYFFTNLYNEYKSKEEVDKNILDEQLLIDIYSPFYKILLKEEIFEKLFILRVPFPIIYDRRLMDDYYDATVRLSELNPNFSSFNFELNDLKKNNDLYDFKDYCAYFKVIKKLVLEIKEHSFSNNFPVKIFSYSNIKNNLIYLELKAIGQLKITNSDNFGEKLKDLNALEELRIDGVISFHLAKRNLKYIYFSNCELITFEPDCFSNMRIINLFRVKSFRTRTYYINKIDIPELIQFKVSFYNREYSSIFNFKSCNKLKYFIRLSHFDFLNLGETALEKVNIKTVNGYYCQEEEEEIKILKKLIEIKTIKEIKIDLNYITEENIKEIKGENTSVEKLIINWMKISDNDYFGLEHKKIKLDGLQEKFPNLKEFIIYMGVNFEKSGKLEINQNSNCKINKFKFSGGLNDSDTIYFYTSPFENLVDIEFACMRPDFNYKESFPLFNEKCETVFKSLKNFKFTYSTEYSGMPTIDLYFIKNLIDNLNKMPNLETFIFKANYQTDKNTYNKLVEKLLLSNIKNIEFNLLLYSKDDYSKEELANLYKDIDIKKFRMLKIKNINN